MGYLKRMSARSQHDEASSNQRRGRLAQAAKGAVNSLRSVAQKNRAFEVLDELDDHDMVELPYVHVTSAAPQPSCTAPQPQTPTHLQRSSSGSWTSYDAAAFRRSPTPQSSQGSSQTATSKKAQSRLRAVRGEVKEKIADIFHRQTPAERLHAELVQTLCCGGLEQATALVRDNPRILVDAQKYGVMFNGRLRPLIFLALTAEEAIKSGRGEILFHFVAELCMRPIEANGLDHEETASARSLAVAALQETLDEWGSTPYNQVDIKWMLKCLRPILVAECVLGPMPAKARSLRNLPGGPSPVDTVERWVGEAMQARLGRAACDNVYVIAERRQMSGDIVLLTLAGALGIQLDPQTFGRDKQLALHFYRALKEHYDKGNFTPAYGEFLRQLGGVLREMIEQVVQGDNDSYMQPLRNLCKTYWNECMKTVQR